MDDWFAEVDIIFDTGQTAINGSGISPVTLTFTPTNWNTAQTRNAGRDIRFLIVNGAVLPHEIEEWNNTGASYVRVRIGSITGSLTLSLWVRPTLSVYS